MECLSYCKGFRTRWSCPDKNATKVLPSIWEPKRPWKWVRQILECLPVSALFLPTRSHNTSK